MRLNFGVLKDILESYRLLRASKAYRLQSQTPDLSTRPVACVLSMVYILCFNVFANHIPSIPNRPMETAWRPHMFAAPFFEMGKFFPDCNLYYFYIKFFAGLADNAFGDHCHIPCQYLSSIFGSEHHVVG